MIPGRAWTIFTGRCSISFPGSRSEQSRTRVGRVPAIDRARECACRIGDVAAGGGGDGVGDLAGRSGRRRARDGVSNAGPSAGHRGARDANVGHRIGSAPSSDPLGDLARASGFHVRPVTLAPDWWRRRGGEPLLGRPGRLRVMCRSPWSRRRPVAMGRGRLPAIRPRRPAAGPVDHAACREAGFAERGPSTARCPTSRSGSSTWSDSA